MSKRSWAHFVALSLASVVLIASCGGSGAVSCEPPPITDANNPDLHPGHVAVLELDSVDSCDPLPSGYQVEQVVTGLEFPLAIAFTPDGRMLVTEEFSGRVRVVEGGELQADPLVTIDAIWTHLPNGIPAPAAGLLGITVDPDFETNHYVYVLFIETVEGGNNIVIERYTEREGRGTEPLRILDGIPGDPVGEHLGGNMQFGPDGKLYVTIGDTCGRSVPGCGEDGDHPVDLAQDLTSPAGSILRLNADGSAPDDNPVLDDPDADPRIFAYGFRNVFDFAIIPATGAIIAGDNGPNTDDEINVVQAGGNYGWPDVLGKATQAPFLDPALVYAETIVPAGMDAYGGGRLEEFENDVFFCQFKRGGMLHRLRLDTTDYTNVVSDEIVAGGCTSAVQTGPDGLIYYADFVSGTIYRITDQDGAATNG